VRLFTGLPLPPRAAEAIADWTASWRSRFGGVAWVAPQLMHISLHFFGEVDPVAASALAGDLDGVAGPAIRARSGAVGRFPPGSRVPPRVIFLSLLDGAAEVAALQARYASRIAGLGYRPEERPYVPHLTLARVKSRPGGLDEISGGPAIAFTFDRVVLYESILRPRGPEYRPVRTLVLEGCA
jgi:RNA 2',3'-cyclic 3'-phosphodiesterase